MNYCEKATDNDEAKLLLVFKIIYDALYKY